MAGDVALIASMCTATPIPSSFLGYWNNESATRKKYTGDPADSWCRTGDLAVMDEQGYLWYQGRSDDVFKAAGYRIGPSEVENCLVKHPAVANAAVVPKPDAERGAVVKVFVVLAPGTWPRPNWWGTCSARARQARALRVPEGDRIRRRPADDDHRQGAATRAPLAGRGAREAGSRRLGRVTGSRARPKHSPGSGPTPDSGS